MSFLVSVAVLAAMFTAALLFALLLVRWLAYSEHEDAPDETQSRAAMDRVLAAHTSPRFRVVRDDDGPVDDAWIARAVHPQQRPQPHYDGGRLTDGDA